MHFFHPSFPRCKIMDARLDELAPKHPRTLFLRASVADTPFLVGKLGIQVLPCVYVFVDGKGVDRSVQPRIELMDKTYWFRGSRTRRSVLDQDIGV